MCPSIRSHCCEKNWIRGCEAAASQRSPLFLFLEEPSSHWPVLMETAAEWHTSHTLVCLLLFRVAGCCAPPHFPSPDWLVSGVRGAGMPSWHSRVDALDSPVACAVRVLTHHCDTEATLLAISRPRPVGPFVRARRAISPATAVPRRGIHGGNRGRRCLRPGLGCSMLSERHCGQGYQAEAGGNGLGTPTCFTCFFLARIDYQLHGCSLMRMCPLCGSAQPGRCFR